MDFIMQNLAKKSFLFLLEFYFIGEVYSSFSNVIIFEIVLLAPPNNSEVFITLVPTIRSTDIPDPLSPLFPMVHRLR